MAASLYSVCVHTPDANHVQYVVGLEPFTQNGLQQCEMAACIECQGTVASDHWEHVRCAAVSWCAFELGCAC